MLRLNIILLFVSCVSSQYEESPIVEYLRNFQNPFFGPVIDNGINGLTTDPPYAEDGQESYPEHTYSFTTWSPFGECSKVCGGGSRERTRLCLDETGKQRPFSKCLRSTPGSSWDLFTLLRARKQMEEVEEELCNKHECLTTEWEQPTACSRKCGGGVITYTRTCLDAYDQSLCNVDKKKMEPCNTQPCFRLGQWRQWSRCTRQCGGGQASRSRSCEPNAPRYSPLFPELQYTLKHVAKIGSLSTIDHENEVYYFQQYIKSCGAQTVQTRYCNQGHCPPCPKNQMYHDCKPCKRFCKRVDLSNILESKLDTPSYRPGYSGCGGKCVPGCGCPLELPLLGSDGACYALNLMCPQNVLNQHSYSYLLLSLLNKPKPVNREPGVARALPTDKPATKKPKRKPSKTKPTSAPAEYTHTYGQNPESPTDYTDTYGPTPESQTEYTHTYGPASESPTEYTHSYTPTPAVVKEIPYESGLPRCPYDIHIMERGICECRDGDVMIDVNCLTADRNVKCPQICKKVGECPNVDLARVKSGNECGTPVCRDDNDCAGPDRCCNLLCGRRCISPEINLQGDPEHHTTVYDG